MNYFSDIDIFAHLSEKDQENFSDFCQVQKLKAWDILFHENDEPQALYVISEGRMLVKKSIWDEQKNIAMLGEGDLVGEMAFFWNPPRRNATLIADTATTLIVILQFSMQQLMEKYPDLHVEVKSVIEERSL